MVNRSNKLVILTAFMTFAAGVGAGFLIRGVVAPLPPHSYRTRVSLPLQDSNGHPVGVLPAGSLIVSKYTLGKSEVGWWGLVPVSLGDGSDATELLAGPVKPRTLSITDMLFVNRVAMRQPSAAVTKTIARPTMPSKSSPR